MVYTRYTLPPSSKPNGVIKKKNSRVKQITITYDYYTTGFGFGILSCVCVPKWTSSIVDCCWYVTVYVFVLLLSLLLQYVIEVGVWEVGTYYTYTFFKTTLQLRKIDIIVIYYLWCT